MSERRWQPPCTGRPRSIAGILEGRADQVPVSRILSFTALVPAGVGSYFVGGTVLVLARDGLLVIVVDGPTCFRLLLLHARFVSKDGASGPTTIDTKPYVRQGHGRSDIPTHAALDVSQSPVAVHGRTD